MIPEFKYILRLTIVVFIVAPIKLVGQSKSFTIARETTNVDAKALNVMPGDTIYLEAGTRRYMRISNVVGDSANYVIITNKLGEVIFENDDFYFGLVLSNCKYFRLTGDVVNDESFGIRILKTGKGASGLSLSELSTNYEVDHIEIANTGFAGIFAFSQPTCDLTANRGNFEQHNTIFRNNYIHDTYGEGMYIGHSFYTGYTLTCNNSPLLVYPHEIKGLKVYNNNIENCGFDGIQVCCAVEDAEIHHNIIRNYGTGMLEMQHSGIQIGAGSKVRCYNNAIIKGSGTGIMMLGMADSYIYNNLIVNAGLNFFPTNKDLRVFGIFVDDRYTLPNTSHYILNNTIINTKTDGIRFLSSISRKNLIANNLIVNPGFECQYSPPDFKYIYLNDAVDVLIKSNLLTNYHGQKVYSEDIDQIISLVHDLPVINKGIDVKQYGVLTDFSENFRDSSPSIGAFELNDSIGQNVQIKNEIKFKYDMRNKTLIFENLAVDHIRRFVIYSFIGRKMYELRGDEPNVLIVNLHGLVPKGIYIITVERSKVVFTSKIFV